MSAKTDWIEVADRVYQRRYDPLDVNVCVVRGTDGLLVVDTRSSHHEADEIRAGLAAFAAPVRAVVNTHAHYDHSFGNFRFGPESDLDVPIYGHERVPAHLDAYERPMLARWIDEYRERVARGALEARDADLNDHTDPTQIVITPPTHLVGAYAVIDLGDRGVDLHHLGRGHTDNDLLLHVTDADAWLVGDLVEESGPPMYGSGSFPLEWPGTLSALLKEASPGTADSFVPGHGVAVSAVFVAAQQADLQTVAALVQQLYDADVPEADAIAAAGDAWPYPVDGLGRAVENGYRQLRAGDVRAGHQAHDERSEG